METADTSSVCRRNSFNEVTFSDPNGIVTLINGKDIQSFPFVFTGINRQMKEEARAVLVKHLKNGDELKTDPFHFDWALPLILLSVFAYGVIKSESASFFQGIVKFISFRGINENASRDMGGMFQWQSTLFNFASFINISLFAFLTALWYGFIPTEANVILYWFISFAGIISALTVRHFICLISGNMSGEKEIFREYLIGVYHSYRLSGLILLVITILILYSGFIAVNILFYTGFSIIALFYIIRIFRLFLIFINRHVSIFYLILYLCALEILPVMILSKYFRGLA